MEVDSSSAMLDHTSESFEMSTIPVVSAPPLTSSSFSHNPYSRENYKHPPNETIYVRNLNEKLSKPELKRVLFLYFGQFGRILDIVALKTQRMRGQAFVVFKELSSANKAVQVSNGFELMGKPMDVSYAKTKSKAHYEHIGRIDAAATLSRQVSRRPRANLPVFSRDKEGGTHEMDTDDTTIDEEMGNQHGIFNDNDSSDDIEMSESMSHANAMKSRADDSAPSKRSKKREERSCVIIEGLPRSADESDLRAFFDKFTGFIGFHSPKRKPWLMLAYYSSEPAAIEAIQRLQGMRIRESPLRLSLDI